MAFDISGPFICLPHDSGYALVLVDYHSRWPEVKFVSSSTTNIVIEFFKEVFAREGCPSTIVTDNGVQLTSKEMESFLKCQNIKHITVSNYEPHEMVWWSVLTGC